MAIEIFLVLLSGWVFVLFYVLTVRLILKIEWTRFDYFQVTILFWFPEAVLIMGIVRINSIALLLIYFTWVLWGIFLCIKCKIYKEKHRVIASFLFILWFYLCFIITLLYAYRMAIISYYFSTVIIFLVLYRRKRVFRLSKNRDKLLLQESLFAFIVYILSFFSFPYFYNG